MIYSKEIENMCPVHKGADHGPAPIPEEGRWVKSKEISDISGLTHGIGWCAPQQGCCKLTDIENLHFIANLDENIGLPRIRQHAVNITKELSETGIDIECITGGLDEYPITPRKAEEYLKEIKPDLVIVAGVPHALYVEELDCETIAVTDGPRLVQPLNELGYSHVIAELDAHSKTLGVDEIVDSDFGMMIRSVIEWELE